MDRLYKVLSDLAQQTGLPAVALTRLSPALCQPPPGSIDADEVTAALDRDDGLSLALVVGIYAATDFRHQGETLESLLKWLLPQELHLSAYDRARLHHIRGFAAWRLHEDLLIAYTALDLSIRLLTELDTPEARAYLGRVWNSFGQIMHHQGRFQEARHDFQVALGYRKQAGDAVDRAFTLGNLARVCIDLADYEAAAAYLEEDLALIRATSQLTPPSVEAQLLSELGHCRLRMGQVDRAAARYQESRDLAQEANNTAGLIFAGLGLGRVALTQKPADLTETGQQLAQVQALIRQDDLPKEFRQELKALADELAGDLAFAHHDCTSALSAYQRTHAHFAQATTTVPGEMAQILSKLAQCHLSIGNEMAAALVLREALALLDATALDQQREALENELKLRFPQLWVLHAAGRFIGQAQIDRFLEQAGQRGFLGEKQQMAVLFSDIRGFTSLSETLAPDILVSLLNRFLTRMTRSIEAEGGMVDKFIGDAVMAIFSESEAAQACSRAARAALMMAAELEHMNLELAEEGHHLDIGIGLHWGSLVSGLIGSPQKRSYTVIGDTVNTCSRLEGMTKTLGAHILVSEAFAQQLEASVFLVRPLGRFNPKGRHEAVSVSELMGLADGSAQAKRWGQDCAASQMALNQLDVGQTERAMAQWRQLAAQEPDPLRARGYHSIAEMVWAHVQQSPGADFRQGIPLREK